MIKYNIKNYTKTTNPKLASLLGKNKGGKCITKFTTIKVGAAFNFKRRGHGLAVGEYSIKTIMMNGKIVKHIRNKKIAAKNLFKLRMCLKRFGE